MKWDDSRGFAGVTNRNGFLTKTCPTFSRPSRKKAFLSQSVCDVPKEKKHPLVIFGPYSYAVCHDNSKDPEKMVFLAYPTGISFKNFNRTQVHHPFSVLSGPFHLAPISPAWHRAPAAGSSGASSWDLAMWNPAEATLFPRKKSLVQPVTSFGLHIVAVFLHFSCWYSTTRQTKLIMQVVFTEDCECLPFAQEDIDMITWVSLGFCV